MTVVGWNAAMHAASIVGQPGKALEFLEEAKVSSAAAQQNECVVDIGNVRKREKAREKDNRALGVCFTRLLGEVRRESDYFLGIPRTFLPPPRKQAKGIKPTEVTYATAIGACAKATTDKKANARKVLSRCVCAVWYACQVILRRFSGATTELKHFCFCGVSWYLVSATATAKQGARYFCIAN